MMPEAKARQTIDALLVAAGWYVCNVAFRKEVRIVAEVGHHPSIVREAEVDTHLKRTHELRQASLRSAFCAST